MSAFIKHNKFSRMSRYDGRYDILSLYTIHAMQPSFCTGKTEYKARQSGRLYSVCIFRTKRRLTCSILMPILCRNQPPLNTLMSDKSTDMHFTARVHWCMHTCTCTALALCNCTCSISSASRHLSGYEGNFWNQLFEPNCI